jgi:outer membrane protein assembly factor BamB
MPAKRSAFSSLLAAIACVSVVCAGTACSQAGSTTAGSAPSPPPAERTLPQSATDPRNSGGHPAAAWPTYNVNAARTGVAAGLPPAGTLSIRWNKRLDGAVYGQPLVVGNDVIAATENDSVYALDRSTGAVVWRAHLGTPVPLSSLPCGDIDPLGITSTPVYDQADGLVYVVAETSGYNHTLFGLSAANGAVTVERYLPTPDGQQRYDQQRPALTIGDGRVYVGFGGLFGDCGPYRGSVVGVPLSGQGALVSYMTPTEKGGAVWATGGPVVGPGGDLWVSTGNGATTGQSRPYDGSDSVSRLSHLNLRRVSFFAPSTGAADNAGDLDLGSTQPVLAAGDATFIVGKRGVGYLLYTPSMGGIGGELASRQICDAFGGAAVSGDTVYEPCASGGMAAVSVDAKRETISVRWRGPAGAAGSPVVGGGAVWVTAYSNTSEGTLCELDPATGGVRHEIGLGARLPHFSSLSLAGGTAFVSTMNGVIAVDGA